jgi:hypothetical protein
VNGPNELPLPIALALGVARLGEVELRGWWRSHGLGRAGRYVLRDAFRWRTATATGLELDLLSASRRQEQILDRPTALHLFSDWLPFRRMSLAWLAEHKTDGLSPFLERLAAWDLDRAIADLADWAAGTPRSGEPLGPGLLLGSLTRSELEDEVTMQGVAKLLCAAYIDQGQDLRPPYFDLAA